MKIGLLSGALPSIAGLFGYFIIPALSGSYYWHELGYLPFRTLTSKPYSYHVMVLAVPSFVGMFGGSLLVRKIGEGSKTTDAILFTAHHSVPVATVLGLFVIGILLPWLGLFQNPSEAGSAALFLVFYTLMGFVIGLLLAAIAVAYVLVAVFIGSISGYVLAWAFTRGWETIERREG